MDPITEQEKNDFREFLSIIYGPQVNNWNINLKVLELFGELLKSKEPLKNSKILHNFSVQFIFRDTYEPADVFRSLIRDQETQDPERTLPGKAG